MMAAQLQIFMTNPASHRLHGNVEFMRQFGRGGGGGGGKNNLFRECRHCCGGPTSVSTKNHMAAAFTLISICPSFQDWQ